MKLFDLRLRGSAYNLGKVVNEIDHRGFRNLIDYLQCGAEETDELPISFELLEKMGIGKYDMEYSYKEEKLEEISDWAVSNEYCLREKNVLKFTDKALQVFEETLKIDRESTDTGGCCCFYSNF